MTNAKEDFELKKSYEKSSSLSKEEFLKTFKIKEEGLTSSEVDYLIKQYGLNELKQAKPKKWYHYFFSSLFSPFNSILLGIACILFYTDVFLATTPSYANILVIVILVISSTLLEFFEEYHSNKAAEKLKEMVETTATVIRDGKETSVPMNQIVLGDIVILSAGSLIPADLRVLESKDLYVGQSSLTGESDAVKKTAELESDISNSDGISDLNNICFMGTNVISRFC